MHPSRSNSRRSSVCSGDYYQDDLEGRAGQNRNNVREYYYEGRPHPPDESTMNAHLGLLPRQSSRPVASCAVEAMNMLLQQYKMALPNFDFTTTRDSAGRSIFGTTVQVKSCIASAKEYNKKLCKQAVCHQLLINIHNRYPRLNIPIYEPPKTVLTKFVGISADICDLAKEVKTLQLDEKEYNSDVKENSLRPKREAKPSEVASLSCLAQTKPSEVASLSCLAQTKPSEVASLSCLAQTKPSEVASLSCLAQTNPSEVASLSCLAQTFPGIQSPQYLDVSEADTEGAQEVVCKLGCEVVKGTGTTKMEAKQNSAKEMMKLLGRVGPAASVRDFRISNEDKETLAEASPTLDLKTTQRKSNDYWASQLKIEAFGSGRTHNESLVSALEKAKALIEEALRGMSN